MEAAVIRSSVAVVALIMMLAGCSPSEPPADQPLAAPVDGPAPAAPKAILPDLTGQEAVTVTATATASNGAALAVSLTSYLPVAGDSPEGQQIVQYVAAAGDGSAVADPEFIADNGALVQLSDLTAIAVSGNWPGESGVLPLLGPGVADTIIDMPAGPVVGSRLSITGPGYGYAAAAIYNEDGSSTDAATWANRFTNYGFADAFAGTTLTDCVITVSPLASAAAGVGTWARHNCFIGAGD